jgi:hypothetical protein
MADMPAGMKINFDEQNMTKWEVMMDGPEQSIYAVCADIDADADGRRRGGLEARLTKDRVDTSSSRLHSRPSIPSSRRWLASGPKSTTPT